MGNCFSKAGTGGKHPVRYLVDENHLGGTPTQSLAAKPAAKSAENSHDPIPVWIARGMSRERPELTELNRRIVLESWFFLRANMIKIGHIMFSGMFDAVPAIMRLFYHNADLEMDLNTADPKLQSKQRNMVIKSHVEKVMMSLDKVVTILYDAERMEYFLHDLGDRHAERTVRIEYFDLVIPFFIKAIHPALTAKWASSIEEAWASFFRHILHVMKEAISF